VVSSAHYVLGPFASDSDLRRHGMKIAQRGGKTPRNERRWRGSSPCYWTGYGSREKSTTRSTTPNDSEAKLLERTTTIRRRR
jgi:hypothetical protein